MHLLSLNIGKPRGNPWKGLAATGIDKRPADGAIAVTAPGPKGTGAVGLAGDRAHDVNHHGGADQALYAYAREDLDTWQDQLGRRLHNGSSFGENLTTAGVDVNGALIGERWRIGTDVLLEVTCPRIPCATFQGWLDEPDWLQRFIEARRPGAYLRVINEGSIRAGDPIEVASRPEHDVTVALTFRALTTEPELLPRLAVATALPKEAQALVRKRTRRPPARSRHPG
jgi:MOSC domain-containing protein YiiM